MRQRRGIHSCKDNEGPMRQFYLACAGVLLLTVTGTPAADDKAKTSPYFPLKIGSKWHFKTSAAKFTQQVIKHEQVGETLCALMEMTKDGTVVVTEHLAVKDDGIYRYSIAGQKPDVPFRVLKLPPRKGDTWDVAVKVANDELKGTFVTGEEEVTVPAGKYQAVTATSKGFELTTGDGGKGAGIVFKFWFAPNVGLVKQTIKIGDRPEVVIELEKYEGP